MLFVGLLLGVLVASPALAFNTYKLGDEDGNVWLAALSFEPGHYIYRISLDTDAGTASRVGTISLIY